MRSDWLLADDVKNVLHDFELYVSLRTYNHCNCGVDCEHDSRYFWVRMDDIGSYILLNETPDDELVSITCVTELSTSRDCSELVNQWNHSTMQSRAQFSQDLDSFINGHEDDVDQKLVPSISFSLRNGPDLTRHDLAVAIGRFLAETIEFLNVKRKIDKPFGIGDYNGPPDRTTLTDDELRIAQDLITDHLTREFDAPLGLLADVAGVSTLVASLVLHCNPQTFHRHQGSPTTWSLR